MNGVENHGLDLFFRTISYIFGKIYFFMLVLVVLFFLELLFPGLRAWSVLLGTGMFENLGLAFILKISIKRKRPYDELENVRMLGKHRDPSFPSNHTQNLMVFSMILLISYGFEFWIFGVIFFIMTFLVGYSRAHLGVHYPTDVIAGFFLGLYIGILLAILGPPIVYWAMETYQFI